eukprot:Skav200371  [mRNA]  locus=scaffold2518:294321:297715:- [translate_table: standard]
MLPDKLLSSLSASGERLSGEAAATDELPTMHDLRRYVQLLVTELERVESCPELLLKEIVRSVRSSLLFFATRLEQVVDASNEIQCLREVQGHLQLTSPMPMPAPGHARNARLFGIAHHTLSALKELLPQRFQQAVVTEQVSNTLKQTQAAVVTPIFDSLQKSLITALLGTSDDLIAVSQASAHLNRYYFSLFGAGQLQSHIKDFCAFAARCFLSAASTTKPCGSQERSTLIKDMELLENMLSALEPDFQSRIRYEASVMNEFKKLLAAPAGTWDRHLWDRCRSEPCSAMDYEELTNVIPLHLLLTYLVHQIDLPMPSLFEFLRLSRAQYLEEAALPLWEEKPQALESFAIELSQFRLLRMVRLVRVLRLMRVVRFCSDLRIMVNGIAGSAKTLFWAMLLLGIVMFIFGVTFMQLAYNHMRSSPADSGEIMVYYGTLGRCSALKGESLRRAMGYHQGSNGEEFATSLAC